MLNDDAQTSYLNVASESLTMALYLSKITKRKAKDIERERIRIFADNLHELVLKGAIEVENSEPLYIFSSPQGLELVMAATSERYQDIKRLDEDFSKVRDALETEGKSGAVQNSLIIKKAMELKNFFRLINEYAESIAMRNCSLESKVNVSGLLS